MLTCPQPNQVMDKEYCYMKSISWQRKPDSENMSKDIGSIKRVTKYLLKSITTTELISFPHIRDIPDITAENL